MRPETVRRILRDDLGKFPYGMQTMQKLKANDKRRQQAMAEALMEKIEFNKNFSPYLILTDETHFHLDGQVNSKNNIFWGEKPPIEFVQNPLYSAKVTAWCGIWSKGIFGPYFFEEDGPEIEKCKDRRGGHLEHLM